MSEGKTGAAEPLAVRSSVVNWLLEFAGVEDIPPVAPAADIGPIDRAKYERRLDLLPGSLSIGRFAKDFPDMDVAAIGERLLDEAYLGSILRRPRVASGDDVVDQEPVELDLDTRFEQLTEAIDLSVDEILMLTGSPDVGLAFSRWGVVVPELRRQPGHTDFTRFGLAIVGRGQAGHKVFEPWTQLIKSYDKHLGPTLVTSPSSNVSGILEFLWNQRESIRRYVDIWRSLK